MALMTLQQTITKAAKPGMPGASSSLTIAGRQIGAGHPVYVIAEMSANHGQNFEQALEIVRAASDCGADAVKLQTLTPEGITLDCDNAYFRIGPGSPWTGRRLHELYAEAQTPWEWHAPLKVEANRLGMALFSSPFDHAAVDFLQTLDVPAYKIASFEIVDLPLIRCAARTGKPLIISTGMATEDEVSEALTTARDAGATEIALLKCTSAYPALPQEMHLRAISTLSKVFEVPVGLSDHSMDSVIPIAAVALGACIVEKHLTLSRNLPGPDRAFSLEPEEFRKMVEVIRITEKAMGSSELIVSEEEAASQNFRRSLFVVEDIQAGETFSSDNVRIIRPGQGLAPRHLDSIIGQISSSDIKRGTPLQWELVAHRKEHQPQHIK